jgi:predicted DCC family thiol-disulfide oxidoreductase YuxK
MTPNNILLFDGVCNLCSNAVQFVLKKNAKENIFFASLQSEVGKSLLAKYHIDSTKVNSLVYIKEGKAYTKSSGALHLSKSLKVPYNFIAVLLIIPKPIRDWIYNIIANKRYKWFGKKETCWLPNPKWKHRFLD